jgi:uncharacterized membrane protein
MSKLFALATARRAVVRALPLAVWMVPNLAMSGACVGLSCSVSWVLVSVQVCSFDTSRMVPLLPWSLQFVLGGLLLDMNHFENILQFGRAYVSPD